MREKRQRKPREPKTVTLTRTCGRFEDSVIVWWGRGKMSRHWWDASTSLQMCYEGFSRVTGFRMEPDETRRVRIRIEEVLGK